MNVRHDDDFKISVNFVGEDGTPLNSFISISGNIFPKFRGFILDDPITIEYFPEDHIGSNTIFSIPSSLYGLLRVQRMNIVEGSLIPFSTNCRSLKGGLEYM